MAPAESKVGPESLQISGFLHKHLSMLKMSMLHQTFNQHLRVLCHRVLPPRVCEEMFSGIIIPHFLILTNQRNKHFITTTAIT